MGKHVEILELMRQAHPAMQFKGFKRSVRAAFGPPMDDVLWLFWAVPDAFLVDKEARTVDVFEVVVWHGMDGAKTNAYARLVQDLREHGIEMTVSVIDEIGRQCKLDLVPPAQ